MITRIWENLMLNQNFIQIRSKVLDPVPSWKKFCAAKPHYPHPRWKASMPLQSLPREKERPWLRHEMGQPCQTTLFRKLGSCFVSCLILCRQETFSVPGENFLYLVASLILYPVWAFLQLVWFCTWYEELGLVKDRQLFLPAEPLNDARHLQVFHCINFS